MMRSALYPRIAGSRMESNHPIRLKILGTVRDPGEFADLKLQWSAMHGKDNMKRAWLRTIYIFGGVVRKCDDQPKIIDSSSFAMCLIMVFDVELRDSR
jgi:hypothetical protein